MTQEETIKQLESLYDYCENMRSSDNDFAVWERDCEAIKITLSALRPITREQVEKMWRGEWTTDGVCRKCGFDAMYYDGVPVQIHTNFCPHCSAPMTDKAVEMVMERMERLYETI